MTNELLHCVIRMKATFLQTRMCTGVGNIQNHLCLLTRTGFVPMNLSIPPSSCNTLTAEGLSVLPELMVSIMAILFLIFFLSHIKFSVLFNVNQIVCIISFFHIILVSYLLNLSFKCNICSSVVIYSK